MFSKLKNQIKANFEKLVKDTTIILYVDIDREKVWDLYLEGFKDPAEKQGHTCNYCKSFLRQYSGIVFIVNNKIKSIWDIPLEEVEELYRGSIKNIQEYIHSLSISEVFLNPFKNLGTNQNTDSKKGITWGHFYLELPSKFIHKGVTSVESVLGEYRDSKNVLKRSLDELTSDACETVLELIAQNSLYRGKEFEVIVQQFYNLKKEYKNIADSLKDNYCWSKSVQLSPVVSRIRNTAIGTLLIDLSEGRELDEAVTAFEKVVAPTNYKRPTAIITPRMIEEAQKRLVELGLINSIERRYATPADISVNDLLFVDRSTVVNGIFSDLKKETQVNPKSLSKIEEIGIEEFIVNIVPKVKSIEILLENSHLNNMVSLLTSVDKDSPSMFKWNNHFSWSYTGGITDSIKEKVKAAGGRVEGELRVSLSWYNYDDLDLHVLEPNGNIIYFRNKVSQTSGHLDVDMNAGSRSTRQPVENIIWTNKDRMKEGVYQVIVNEYNKRETTNQGFIVEVECNGELFNFEYKSSPRQGESEKVVILEYNKVKGLTIKGESKSTIVSRDKWNVKTNQFTKVKSLMLSPNYWDKPVGNKHYLFMLENCISDESARPFFNEFLKEDLSKERKVLEVMASKLKVESNLNQLSGVGFSETQRDHLIARVEGAFKRNLKINF